MNNPKIGQYELIIKELIDSKNHKKILNSKLTNEYADIPFFDNATHNLFKNEDIKMNKMNNMNKMNKMNNMNKIDKINKIDKMEKINELEDHINKINKKIITGDYNTKIMENYIQWINKVKGIIVKRINENKLYYFFNLKGKTFDLKSMIDYYDVPETDKLFSFTLFIGNVENLTYFIGLVYYYAIMRKHF